MSSYKEDASYSDKTSDCLDLPSRYNVYLLNDDYTTMEFVVSVLMNVFHKSSADAESIMLSVHKSGRGLCGTYVFEVAETKVATVKLMAEEAKFPLRCVMEEA